MENKKFIEANIKLYTDMLANIQKSYFKDFKERCREFFEAHKEVESISISIWYPAFNDGDACTPAIRAYSVKFNEETEQKLLQLCNQLDFTNAKTRYDENLTYESPTHKHHYYYKPMEEPKEEDFVSEDISDLKNYNNSEKHGFTIMDVCTAYAELPNRFNDSYLTREILTDAVLYENLFYIFLYAVSMQELWINEFGDYTTVQLGRDLNFVTDACSFDNQ